MILIEVNVRLGSYNERQLEEDVGSLVTKVGDQRHLGRRNVSRWSSYCLQRPNPFMFRGEIKIETEGKA